MTATIGWAALAGFLLGVLFWIVLNLGTVEVAIHGEVDPKPAHTEGGW